MRTRLCSLCSNLAFATMLMVGTGMIVTSCSPDDLLEDSYPSWLGSSIYGELGNRGNFKYTLRLIDDLDYASVLSKTGSKTLFVADDDSWNRFFASDNDWGVKSYDQLSLAQKKWLLKSAMLNSAYLGEKLSTISLAAGTAGTGTPVALRRANSTSPVDSITLYVGAEAINNLPTGPIGSTYWANLKANALSTSQDTVRFSFSDNDAACMVHFPQDLRSNKNMTDEDVKFLFGVDNVSDIYIFGDPIVEQDITCQNGYVHVLKDLLVAPDNMDMELKKVKSPSVDVNTSIDPNVIDASLFSSLLDRYTMPVAQSVSGGVTTYRKAYFSDDASTNSTGSATAKNPYSYRTDSSGTAMSLISFDPSWHRYAAESNYQQDMPVIFVPTTGALNEWRKSTTGQLVMPSSKYPTWSDVPEELLAVLINNHMKGSFFGALPSVFSKVLNDGGREQKISKSDVLKTIVTNNGVIYMVNQVYTPDAYVSVFAPCLNVEELTIMNYAVTNTDQSNYIPKGYQVYLNNMESNFSFFAPTNDALSSYRDPSYTSEDKTWRRISFGYSGSSVISTPQIMNADGSVNQGTQSASISSTLQASLLKDILENCIVVMDKADWSHGGWFKTKGGGMVYVTSFAQGANVYSGGNLEMQEATGAELPAVEVLYDQTRLGNGMTCQLSQPIQPTLNSVINVLQNHSDFSEFTELMLGNDTTLAEEYPKTDSLKLYQPLVTNAATNSVSRDQRVGFLSNYNYTLYAPNNAAMAKAYQQGLPTWDEVNALTDLTEKKRKAKQIMAFIRTHFQDNSICTDGTGGNYKSQAFDSELGIFYQLEVTIGSTMTVESLNDTDSNKEIASVYSTDLSNLQAREYVFNGTLARGSDSGTATSISQSSYVVIHGINAPLFFSARENGIRTQFK